MKLYLAKVDELYHLKNKIIRKRLKTNIDILTLLFDYLVYFYMVSLEYVINTMEQPKNNQYRTDNRLSLIKTKLKNYIHLIQLVLNWVIFLVLVCSTIWIVVLLLVIMVLRDVLRPRVVQDICIMPETNTFNYTLFSKRSELTVKEVERLKEIDIELIENFKSITSTDILEEIEYFPNLIVELYTQSLISLKMYRVDNLDFRQFVSELHDYVLLTKKF